MRINERSQAHGQTIGGDALGTPAFGRVQTVALSPGSQPRVSELRSKRDGMS